MKLPIKGSGKVISDDKGILSSMNPKKIKTHLKLKEKI